jgi:hypothetical protein
MAKQRLIKRYIPRTNQTHGLSGKEAHRLDVSDCADVRRHTGEPLKRYLGTTNDRVADDGFVRPGILGFTLAINPLRRTEFSTFDGEHVFYLKFLSQDTKQTISLIQR